MNTTTEQQLTAHFGPSVEPAYDEETQTNMRVHQDIAQLDRIVSVAYEDPLPLAN